MYNISNFADTEHLQNMFPDKTSCFDFVVRSWYAHCVLSLCGMGYIVESETSVKRC